MVDGEHDFEQGHRLALQRLQGSYEHIPSLFGVCADDDRYIEFGFIGIWFCRFYKLKPRRIIPILLFKHVTLPLDLNAINFVVEVCRKRSKKQYIFLTVKIEKAF